MNTALAMETGKTMNAAHSLAMDTDGTNDFDCEPVTLVDVWADIPTGELVYDFLRPMVTEVPLFGDLRGEE